MITQVDAMSRYRILLLTPSKGIRGGVADFCRILLDNMNPNFHVECLEVGNRSGNESFIKRVLYFTQIAYRLVAKLKNGSYQIVHLNPSFRIYSILRDSAYLFIINRLGYRNKAIVFFHGWNAELAESIVNKPFLKNTFARIYRNVGVIFVLHSQCKRQIVNMGIKSERVKLVTTTYERISGIEQRSDKKMEQKVNILFMSRLVEGKGVYIAAETAKLLVQNGYNDFRLTLAGDGPLLTGLRKFIGENHLEEYTEILGFVRGKKKKQVLRKGDIFLLPTSLQEGCPVALIEAMGSGQAIISTPRGAIPEVVKDGEHGIICNAADPDLFFEAVKKLLEDRHLLTRMQQAARAKAEENYEASVYTKKIQQVYLGVIRST